MSEAQIVPFRDRVNNIRGLLEKMKPQLAMALPSHLNVDRLLRVAMTSIQKNPKLLEATVESLLGAIMECAQLGLEPDGLLGHAYLVPFKVKKGERWATEVVLIPGYKGLLKLVRNTGQLSTVMASVVYKNEEYSIVLGLDPKLEHRPSEDPGGHEDQDIRAAYAVARLKDGALQFANMWRWEIDKIRARSKARDQGPWITDYPEMAKKTVLRRLAKLLPASVEVQRAVALDERAEAGISQDIDLAIDLSNGGQPPENGEPKGKLDKLVDAAKADGAKPKTNDSQAAASNNESEKPKTDAPAKKDGVADYDDSGNLFS